MLRRSAAEPPAPVRRRPAGATPPLPEDTRRSTTDILVRSWAGRLLLASAAVKLVLAALRAAGALPAALEILSTLATLGLIVALAVFAGRLFALVKRHLLWRVRRKLTLSYIFIGVVPALLLVGFFLFGASIVSGNIAGYLFKDGYDDVLRNATVLAEGMATEIARLPQNAAETLERSRESVSRSRNYPALSLAFVPQAGAPPVAAGPWTHGAVPGSIPAWIQADRDGFAGSVVVAEGDGNGRHELALRAVRRVTSAKGTHGWVVADIPLDGALVDQLHESTGVKPGSVQVSGPGARPAIDPIGRPPETDGQAVLFGHSVAFFDVYDWESGQVGRATLAVTYRVGELYRRLTRAQSTRFGPNVAEFFLVFLVAVAVLFLIIELAALVMGLALARSITSSIHELFMGTERVRQGDFSHRIDVRTKDQLGELADSFNQMTGSIENLLQTAAEKKRMEEELRIARQIQMSLLPRGPLDVPGLSMTALCVPAREVGGDYYDFFRLGDQRLGVLIADVSGKGTSAALYMAELKGIVLSLSEIYQSPRELLIAVNRIISDHLDSRSFITVTYAVFDLARGVMTYARAGHTPLIHLPAAAGARQAAQVLTPSGLVLGLRIDGAAEKFAELLEEQQVRLEPGDVIVFYTDGITEAMNASSDLFGESRLSRLVEEHGHLDSGELRERILREIESFVGTAEQHDDMTMILIKVERPAAARVAV